MKIICAGLSKTGTKSVAKALRTLGYEVHDFEEHMEWYMDEYIQALNGEMPDFNAMYSNVDAVTDSPACLFWEEISQSFPGAKVVLMERDPAESWPNSYLIATQVVGAYLSSTWNTFGLNWTPTGCKFVRFVKSLDTKIPPKTDNDAMLRFYLSHNAQVKASVPRDQLLVYNVKQGRDPLCEFLGVEVPDVPFPRLNVNNQMLPDVCFGIAKRIHKWYIAVVGDCILVCDSGLNRVQMMNQDGQFIRSFGNEGSGLQWSNKWS